MRKLLFSFLLAMHLPAMADKAAMPSDADIANARNKA